MLAGFLIAVLITKLENTLAGLQYSSLWPLSPPGPFRVFVLVTQADLLQILFFAQLNPASVACQLRCAPLPGVSLLVLSSLLLVIEGGKNGSPRERRQAHRGVPRGLRAYENTREEGTGKAEVEGIPLIRWLGEVRNRRDTERFSGIYRERARASWEC